MCPEILEENEDRIGEDTMVDYIDPTQGFRFAPGEGQIPIPMFKDPFCKEKSFPTIFGGHPTPATKKGISQRDIHYHEMFRYDRRGARPDYLFYILKVDQLHQLQSAQGISMRKSAQTNDITAAQVRNKDFIDNSIRKDNAYHFMANVVGSPAYWEDQKKKVIAMVRQLGIFTLFITLTAAETKWPELIRILKLTVDKEEVTLEEAEAFKFEEKARLIRTDPVTCARYFDYRFKELKKTWTYCDDGPFGKHKIKEMFYRIEFQHRGSPHVHMVIWLEDAPVYKGSESEEQICDFINSMITTDTDNPEVTDQVGKQFHKCTHTCKKGDSTKCRFGCPLPPMDKTRILQPLSAEELEKLKGDKEMMTKIRKFNEQLMKELEHNALNIGSFEELLAKMNVDLDFYIFAIRATIKHAKIFLKRDPKNCRTNAYCKKILLLMKSNMDIQFVLDAFACIGYIVDYVNKSSRGLSRLLRQCVEDHKRGNKSIREQMKACCNIMYNSTEISAQEAAWLKCRLSMCETSVGVEFISTGPSDTRHRILKNDVELKALPDGSTDIYKKNDLDRYGQRPEEMKQFCLADVVALYSFEKPRKSSNSSNTGDEEEPNDEAVEDEAEQMDDTDDTIQGPSATKKPRKVLPRFALKDGSGNFVERRKPKVIRYCRFNRATDPDNFFREMCLLFLPWENEQTDIEGTNCMELYDTHKSIIEANYKKYNACDLDFDAIAKEIEEYRATEDQGLLYQNRDESEHNEQIDPAVRPFINVYEFDDNIVQPNAAIEMGLEEVGGTEACNKYNIPTLWRDAEYFKLMDNLNPKQRDIVMHVNSCFQNKDKAFHIFLTGGAGTGKSQVIKALYQSLSRQFRSERNEDISAPEILLVAFTGLAAHNIDGQTAHSALHLSAGKGDKFTSLSPDRKNTLRCQFHNLKLVIIDEISMLGSPTFDHISRRLGEIFNTSPNLHFGDISVIVVGDFNQLSPVGAPYVFHAKDSHSTAALAGNPQWALFKIFRLDEIMRQRDDLRFAEALNRLANGACTAEDEAMWKSRCFKEEDLPEIAKKTPRMYERNADIDEYNKIRVDEQKLHANPRFCIVSQADDRKVGKITKVQEKQADEALLKLKTREAQNLPASLELVENLRYMISTNIDVNDGLYNGALGTLKFIEYMNNRSHAVYLEFDSPNIGTQARANRKSIMEQNKINQNWTPIFRVKRKFNLLGKGTVQVCREQYPLVISEARTIHKSQGMTQEVAVVCPLGRKLSRQKAYTAFSRVTSLSGLFIVGDTFKTPDPPSHDDSVVREMLRMDTDCKLVPKFLDLRLRANDTVVKIISHNIQSLAKHSSSIVKDKTYTECDFMFFQETWLVSSLAVDIERFHEITRNPSSSPSAQGTIIYRNVASKSIAVSHESTEIKEESSHVEVTAVVINEKILAINVYKNPTCSDRLFLEAIDNYAALINRYEDVLMMGDFNTSLASKNSFIRIMATKYGLILLSSTNPTTRANTCIDGVFGKLYNYKIKSHVYFSYFSHHYPLVIELLRK